MVIGIAAVAGLFIILILVKRRRHVEDIAEAVTASENQERKGKTRKTKSQDGSSSDLAPSPTFFMGADEDSVVDVDNNENGGSSIELSLDDGAAGSFSTVDYDYAKANGDSSIVSSVGGTLGEQTLNSIGNSIGTMNASLSSQREYSVRSSVDERLLGATALQSEKAQEKDYFKVKLPEHTKQLGMVIHSPADMTIGAIPVAMGQENNNSRVTEYPVVHALKESSPLIALGVQTGDLLIRINQKSVGGESAFEVSKIIRAQMTSADGCTLSFLRPSTKQQKPGDEVVWNT